jgi:hypothetical protein
MSKIYSIVQKNDKFIVTKNGEPILLPKSDGQSIVTQFDSREDAQQYLSILENLLKRKEHKKVAHA